MRIGIIGGGITGLTAAYELLKKGFEVELLEAGSALGGIAGTFELEGNWIEKYYHHFFKSDRHIIALMQELGIESSLRWHESRMGYFADGESYSFGTPVSLLGFRPLPFTDKVRFGMSVLSLMGSKRWQPLENITAKEWLIKNAGLKAYEKVWKPLLVTKFGEEHDKIAMSWLWGKIKLRGSSKEKGQEVLGYIDGSTKVLIDKLRERLEDGGAKICLNSRVSSIQKAGCTGNDGSGAEAASSGVVSHGDCRGFIVKSSDGIRFYDKVISTVPLPVFAEIASDILPAGYMARIRAVEYTSVVCMVLVLKRPFSSFYWLNIGDESIPFGGLIEHTNMIDRKGYGGKHILYISNYLYKNSRYYRMESQELLKEYMPHLVKINPGFDESWVEQSYVFRDEYAQPIVKCGYSALKPDFATPVEGLYAAGMCNIYPEDRGMNYAIRDGKAVSYCI